MIYGLETDPLPEGSIPLEAMALIKSLDADGHTEFLVRNTKGLSDMEALGMLTAAQTNQLEEVCDGFIDEGVEDDD